MNEVLEPYLYTTIIGKVMELLLHHLGNLMDISHEYFYSFFRKGATITKLGRYLLATGGVVKKKQLNSIEVFDPKNPKKGWKKLEKLQMPVSVSDHCTVTLDTTRGKQVVITGGRGREKRTLKLDVKTERLDKI